MIGFVDILIKMCVQTVLKPPAGFSLVELLLALAVVGVTSAFVVPKLLIPPADTDQSKTLKAKSTMKMVATAYQKALLDDRISAATRPQDLTPYMNYVRVDTSSIIDARPGQTSINCSSSSQICLVMHHGGILRFFKNTYFGGTTATRGLYMTYDPDSSYSGSSTGEGKGVEFMLYYDGVMRSYTYYRSNTCWSRVSLSDQCENPNATRDPSWWTWE